MKPYYPHQRFKRKRSIVALVAVIALAAIFVAAGVTLALVERNEPLPEVTGMEFLSDKLGAYADFDNVFVKVAFSDGKTQNVPLSQLLPTGIDKEKDGYQNVKLSYGDQEFTIRVNVVTANMTLRYVTSGEGGSIVGETEQTVPAGADGSEVEAVPSEGYEFDYWSDNAGKGAVRKDQNVLADAEYRAVFKKKEFIVTFLFADGTSREQTVKYGERAVPIPDTDSRLKKYGYRFDGWDTDEWQHVTKNVTIRPKMTRISAAYDVYVSAMKGEPMGVKSITDTNVETDSLNGLNVSQGMDDASGLYLYKGYYQWGLPGEIKFTTGEGRKFVRFEVYGAPAEGGTPAFYNVYPGSDVLLWIAGASEATGFTANGDAAAPALSFAPPENAEIVTVRAIFAEAVSTISFFARGSVQRTAELPFGESLTAEQLRSPGDREGADFDGWYDDRNVKIGTNHEPFYTDATLNARYIPKTITVDFTDWNGNLLKRESADYDFTIKNDDFATAPNREHYRADGWIVTESDDPKLVGTVFNAETRLKSNVTVVPNYQRIRFDATFEKVGQGRIFYTETDGGAAGAETELTELSLQVLSGASYAFRFAGAGGYAFRTYRVSFAGGSSSEGTGANVQFSDLREGFFLKITFVREEHVVSIENGSAATGAGGVTILENVYGAENFTVTVLDGMPLELGIAAPKDMRIAGIFLLDSASNPGGNLLPDGVFDGYTYHYAKNGGVVKADVAIRITYEVKTFTLRPSVGAGGAVRYYYRTDSGFKAVADGEAGISVDAQGAATVPFGTDLKGEIAANAGKYVSNLTLYGKSVDFYQYYYESYADALYASGDPYFFTDRVQKGFKTKDPRVSAISFYLPAPTGDVEVSATFDDVYYEVSASASGFGNASFESARVKEGEPVALTMTTEESYVVTGYELTTYGAETLTVKKTIGDNASSMRETIADVRADLSVVVFFGRRTYSVLFYDLAESGVSYRIESDGATGTVDTNRTVSDTIRHGDGRTYLLTASEGYEFREVRLVDGHGSDFTDGSGNPLPGYAVTLPVNTDRYELVLNSVAEAYGVIVTLERKNCEVAVTTNAVSDTVGRIALAADGAEVQYAAGGAAFSYRYGTEVTVKVNAGQTAGDEFRVSYFSIGGTVYPLLGDEISVEKTFTVSGATGLEVRFAYAGTKTGVVVDPSVGETTHGTYGQHGYVTYRLAGASAASGSPRNAAADSTRVVEYRAFADEGYVLKGLYVNGETLGDDGFGVYSAALNENSFHYVTAIFEKRALKLTLTAENGALKSEKDYVPYGESAMVWFVPNTGYELTSLKKNGKNLTEAELAEVKEAGFLTLLSEDTVGATETVSVGAVFSPIGYKLYGTFDPAATGTGKVVLEDGSETSSNAEFDVFYGRRMTFRFVAAEGSYLASITLNGVAVDLSTLENSVTKPSNGKYASGQFDLVVTGETRVVVRFDNDVFKVTVADAPGGATTLPQSVSGNDEYSSDESITISMKAFSGYHIAALYINGAEVSLNFTSLDEPNLNTSILYLVPREFLVRNLTVRAEYVRNVYGVKITVRNDSPNFKATDNVSDRFLDKLALEYGGRELAGVTESDRANSSLSVSFGGIEHAGSPRATIQPKLSSGYYLKKATITFATKEGNSQTVDYTAYFTESNRYAVTLPALYWDVTEFSVTVARRMVTARIPSEFRTASGKTAIRVTPVFYAGSVVAVPAENPAGDVYTYEFGVRAALDIALAEGFTATRFTLKTGNVTRDFLGDLDFRYGHAVFSTTLTDETEFSYAAEVTRVTLTLDKIGTGSGAFNFLINGSAQAGVREITVDYGEIVGVSVIAERMRGSYIAAIRIDGQRQELGAGDADGVHYEVSISGKAVKNAAYEVELSILEYRFTVAETEGLQGYSFNNDSVNVFPWGTERVNVRIELRLGYKLTGLSVNGTSLSEGDYTRDGSVVTFRIDKVSSDQEIVPEVEKMTFTAANSAASGAENLTTIYRAESDGTLTKLVNNMQGNVAYGDRLIFEFRPAKNYFADEYAITMKDLNGVGSAVSGTESFPEANNSDVIRVDLGLVTGDVYADVKYSRKLYVISYTDSVGAAGVGEVSIGGYQILGGDSTIVAIRTKNLMRDGKPISYGLSSLKVNGREYFTREVPFTEWGACEEAKYDGESGTYAFRYNLIASDALMNGAAGIVGSGRDFTLNLEIKIEKNLYFADEILVRNVEKTPAEVKTYPIGGGTFPTEYFTGQFFETILDGSSNLVGLDMIEGYSPKCVNVIVTENGVETEKTVQAFGENAGSQKVFVTASASIADMSDPYRKTIRFVVEVDRNRYETGLTVLTHEQNGAETTVGANARGVTATLDGEASTDDALARISHGGTVVMLAGEQIDYDFAGFERYDETASGWVAAENVTENGRTIVSVEGRELTVSVVRAFRFRAVYYKKVKVDVVVAPWHKYVSGAYVSGNGEGVNYVTYASVLMTVQGVEKHYEVEPEKNGKGIFRYVFRYGDEALLQASDKRTDLNYSDGADFYYQNGGAETLEPGEASGREFRFRAVSDHFYDDALSANDALYVAFDNDIKLNSAAETLGGKDPRDGGSFTYERKSFGSYSYSPLAFSGKTANVKMFDRIRITAEVTDGYRFESFSRYKDRNDRSEVNLQFNATETFARYAANGFDDWDVETAGEGLESDPRVSVRTEVQSGKRKLIVEFTVVDNSIYRFDFVKVYDVTGFVSAPRYLGDTENAVPPVSVTVAGGNKSYFVSDASGVRGKLDFGAKIAMSVAFGANDPLRDASKWQFTSWYANGVSGFGDKRYFDPYEDMTEFVLDERYVSSEKFATTFTFYAEFLPIYSIATREYFKIGGATFRPTNAFEMSALFYDRSSGVAEIPLGAESVKIDGELATRKYLPFDARKHLSGNPVSDSDRNAVRFSVSAANSYMITEWRVYYGNYDAANPDPAAGETFAGNTMNLEFGMTREIFAKLAAAGEPSEKTITIVPVFHKQNSVNIRRSVFYNGYGEIDPTGKGMLENQPGIEIGGRVETVDGERIVSYGDTVVLKANPDPSYRFIGWFDPGDALSSMTPKYTKETHTFVANLTGNEANTGENGYIYAFEARYIRTVTLTLETLNVSGILMKGASADILKGNSAESGWLYNGADVTRGDPSKLKTIEADNAGRKASLQADVGSYALLKLSNAQSGTFDPTYDVFYDCAATEGATDCTASRQSDGSWKLVVYLDRTKTIMANYQTYGAVTVTGLLDRTVVTLGAKLSKNLYDYSKLLKERELGAGVEVTDSDLLSTHFDTAEVASVRYANGILTAVMNASNQTGSIRIRGVKKDNYAADGSASPDVLSFRFNGFTDAVRWEEPFALNFSGNMNADRTASAALQTMPFAGGGGTAERPYEISDHVEFTNLDKMYGLNGNTLFGISFKQTANLTLSSSWRPMCSAGSGFNGILDGGNNYLYVPTSLESSTMANYGGIFAKTSVGTIRQYRFAMAGDKLETSHKSADTGIVAGVANGTNFVDLHFEGISVKSGNKSFGLVAGSAADGAATRIDVTNLDLEYSGNDVGSVFGTASGRITIETITITREANSSATLRNTSGGGQFVGGIVGTLTGAEARLRNSFLYGGVIRAAGPVGGAVGYLGEGATVSGIEAVLKTTVAVGGTTVAQTLQVASDSVLKASVSTSVSARPISESDMRYAAGGIVGFAGSKSVVTGCSIKSEVTGLMTLSDNGYEVNRYYPAVSVFGTVAGGIVGWNGQGATVSESYIESDTGLEILMPSQSGLAVGTTAGAGADGIFGGIVGENGGTVSHCGINGQGSYELDKQSSESHAETLAGDRLGPANTAANPFHTTSGQGCQMKANVEFLYAAYSGQDGLGIAIKNNFYYGANFMLTHGSNNSYTGVDFAARGTSTTLMGGIVGYNTNRGAVSNCYVEGKVVHFRRNRPEKSGITFAVLGGIVGFNANAVYGSGLVGAAVYNFVKPVNDDTVSNVIVSAGGLIGQNTGAHVKGNFVFKSAVRAVNDPFQELGTKTGKGYGGKPGSAFRTVASATLSGASGQPTAAAFTYAKDIKISATSDTVEIDESNWTIKARFAMLETVNMSTKTPNVSLGGFANGNVIGQGDSNTLASIIAKALAGGELGSNFYIETSPALLDASFVSTGGKLRYLGRKSGQFITLV